MRNIDYSGEFYLPNSNKRYPGRIIGSDESSKLILEIYGVESIEGKRLVEKGPMEIEYYHQLILGHCLSPSNLTLIDCYWQGTNMFGKNFFQIRYEIRIIFKGVLIADYSDFKFNNLTICLPFLASWYDGWESLNKVDELSEQESHKIQSLSINENLTLQFVDYLNKFPRVIGKSYEINYQKYLQFKYSAPTHFEEIILDITKFRRLLEFSATKRIHFKLIDAEIDKSIVSIEEVETNNREVAVVSFDNYTFSQRQDVYKHFRHQNYFLFSRWQLDKDVLEKLTICWFSNTTYYHIYDFYLDTHNWFEGTEATLSNVMFNNRCLNLVQALEDYHRKRFDHLLPDIDIFNSKKSQVLRLLDSNKELKQWANNRINFNKAPYLNERLNDLINNSKGIIKELFDDVLFYQEFPDLAKKYRDMLAHGNLKGTSLGNELHFLFHSAQLLLAIVILQSINLDNDTIQRLIKSNVEFKRIISSMKLFKSS